MPFGESGAQALRLANGERWMTTVTASVLTADIGDKSRRPLLFHLQRGNERIFSIDNNVT